MAVKFNKYLSKKVAILYSDAKREYFPTEEQYITEVEVFERAQKIKPYLEKLGYEVDLAPGDSNLPDWLKNHQPNLVFNLVDSVRGKEPLASVIPGTLELIDVPYLGTGMLGLSINSNKFLTKKLLEQAGVPIPRYQLFQNPNDPLDVQLKFPLISKLNEVHGSVAIDQTAVSENEFQLRARLKSLIDVYKQPVVVEEFIVGREFTVFVLEGAVKKVYIGEKVFNPNEEKFKIATFEAVWKGINSYDYQKVSNNGMLENYARSAFDILKMDDYAKFDVRLDESGRYFFIDCNANPAFGPIETDCAISHVLKMYNVNFDEILRRLITHFSKEQGVIL